MVLRLILISMAYMKYSKQKREPCTSLDKDRNRIRVIFGFFF
uniref:Uncharacterized protein n=1 Tax=Arundo donax TaxID=35708 RepID=A0A0A9U9E1_ARUDO